MQVPRRMCEASFEVDRLYPRVTDLEDGRSVNVYQSEVGDVGCVIWDAAIVLAKFYEHLLSADTSVCTSTDSDNEKQLQSCINRLSSMLQEFPYCQERRTVVELGSGTGYVGIIAAAYG